MATKKKDAPVQPMQHLAICSCPMQEMGELYDPETALQEGTIFPELNLPFFKGGRKDEK